MNHHREDIGEFQEYKALLWTAPELLREGKERPFYGTQKGDVFSYGIILQEIVYRVMPYFIDMETPKGNTNKKYSTIKLNNNMYASFLRIRSTIYFRHHRESKDEIRDSLPTNTSHGQYI